LPVFALEVAAGGPKFRELKPGEVASQHEPAPQGFFAKGFNSIEVLMSSLNNVYGGTLNVDRPVVDRTNLTGKYDIYLRTEMEVEADENGRRVFRFPNLEHDMQTELGLKLVAERVRMPYYVVEHAADPTPN
jgi:uncharacterized protein (TIGR03435 family)